MKLAADDNPEPTEANVALTLDELEKLYWINAWSLYDYTDQGHGKRWYIYTMDDQEVHLQSPVQVAIWIDGFLAGKGEL